MSDQHLGIELSPQIPPFPSPPIFRLPPELLHIIFDAARRDPPSNTPFTLSHVCRSWRSFMLASPSFWTTLIVGQSPPSHLEYYDLWFQRARDLDLSLYVHTFGREMGQQDLKTFYYLLYISNRLWKEIELVDTLNYDKAVYHGVIAELILGHLPNIRKLHIPLLKIPPQFIRQYNGDLTSIQNMEYFAIHASVLTCSPDFSFTGTRLRRIYITYDENSRVQNRLNSLSQILQQVSNQLEALRIQIFSGGGSSGSGGVPGGGPSDFTEPWEDIISLPRLTELDLSWGTNNSKGHLFNTLLSQLRTPNLLILQDLALILLGVMEEFYPGLTQLVMTGRVFDMRISPEYWFCRAFSKFSNLHSVEFKHIAWQHGEFAAALLISCPRLIRVCLRACSLVYEWDLRRLVEGRRASEKMTRLEYLGLLGCEALDLNEKARAWYAMRLKRFEYEVETL